jgi:ferric-dicitrate binding protein FerR (iron transport regulator)
MTEEIFIRFLQNKCTADEIDEVVRWLHYEADDKSAQLMVKQIWNKYSAPKDILEDIQFETILDKIHHKININESKKIKHFNTSDDLHSKKPIRIKDILTRAAAILFIPLLSVLIYTQFVYKSNETISDNSKSSIEIESPLGSRTNIELADGTRVWLNNGSKLKYPSQFTGKKRVVHLIGEAFFDVAHNSQKPFIVKTKEIQVTALGTEFNVMAYEGEGIVEATLVSGKVKVEKRLKNGKAKEICIMKPNQIVKLDLKNRVYSSNNTNIKKYVSWIDGVLVFDNDPIDEVVRRLSKWYNVEFVIVNPEVRNFVYNATFIDETLPQILELMKIATPITYKISSRKKLNDGTFTKRKVFIGLKKNH